MLRLGGFKCFIIICKLFFRKDPLHMSSTHLVVAFHAKGRKPFFDVFEFFPPWGSDTRALCPCKTAYT